MKAPWATPLPLIRKLAGLFTTKTTSTFYSTEVIPLVLASSVPAAEPNLNPSFHVDAVEVVLHPLEIVSIAVDRLGERVASLADEADRIIAAIDLVISRARR